MKIWGRRFPCHPESGEMPWNYTCSLFNSIIFINNLVVKQPVGDREERNQDRRCLRDLSISSYSNSNPSSRSLFG